MDCEKRLTIKNLIRQLQAWFEWQDAKCWAKAIHPGWVQLATKARSGNTRMIYRDKILMAYRGDLFCPEADLERGVDDG